ncbi:MAG: hypothetical protein B7Z47_02995 [Chthoniobacter sp. 12-60-6]|nr:MAG: hypothetical protein B7Z47_02995 [Chthoniobacter sp. 12-60-6]
MTRDQKIAAIAIDLICNASMKRDLWRATSIGMLHAEPAIPLKLGNDERPLVSASFAEGDWYVWTTRRLVSFCDKKHYEVNSESIFRAEFGNFKEALQPMNPPVALIPTTIATFSVNRGVAARIRYETGYASMGPIQCFKYWELKHPILDKLMTPSEHAAYLKQRNAD